MKIFIENYEDLKDEDGNTPQDYNHLLIKLRIACPSAGYPHSEALYTNIQDYLKKTGTQIWQFHGK